MRSYRIIFPYLRQGLIPLLVGILLLLSVDFLQLVIPRFIKGAIDALTAKQALGSVLTRYCLLILATALLIFILRMIWRRLIFGQARRIEEALRNRLFDHLLTLSQSYYHRTSIGNLMAHATNDMEAVRMALGMGLVSLVDSLILGSAAIGFMAYINLKLTLISLWPMPLVAFLTQRLTKLLDQRFELVQGTFSKIMEKVRESLVGIMVVKAYTLQEREERNLACYSLEYQDQNIRLVRITGTLFPLSILMTNLSLAVVLWIGGQQVLAKEITTGDFVAFISYLGLLSWPVMALGWVINLIKRGAVSLERIERILEERPEIADLPGLTPPTSLRAELKVKDLTFSYSQGARPVLRGIGFEMAPGRQYLITGKTGSGKTTLALLMIRLLESSAGSIFLDGHEIHSIPLSDLRKTVSLIPQEPFLFSDTIRANLLLARPDAEEKDLWECLTLAAFQEEVRTFPKGLDTVVGEKGVLLSGGQKQRLSLARTLLVNPPILILDNTLSSVDLNTERIIQENLGPFRKGKITIYISHLLIGLEGVDNIFLLEAGELAETGTHEQLLGKEGLYFQLYRYQRLEMELRQGVF
ncbi:MAG: ABC transporter ATP-binding protein [Deltaproteobacteria bacterium]|nr:ABC transporter ATP-binding protein [Deltaproteobacteria bacterium]